MYWTLTIYLLEFAYVKAMGIPAETFVAKAFANKTTLQIGTLVITVCIVAPIGEELAFRFFLLGALPYERSEPWAVASIILTSVLFFVLHSQYEHTPTLVLLFAVACSFAVARIMSNGLLLPIVMHALSAATVLVLRPFY